MSTGGNAARLASLTQALVERWHTTRGSWSDAKAQEFENRFMKDLESAVESAVIGIEQLESVLRTIRRDCE